MKRLFAVCLAIILLFSTVSATCLTVLAEDKEPTVKGYFETVEITEGGAPLELESFHRYVITKDVTFEGNETARSGLRVQPDAKVIIEIKKGARLTCRGFNSENTVVGGGAGIEVPETSILIITGEGYLNAYGGNASSGFDGEDGEPGAFTSKLGGFIYAGAGGNGGEGGGGAGAGIGGCGGEGVLGGTGGIFPGMENDAGQPYYYPDTEMTTAFCTWEKADCTGYNGQNGGNARDGMNAGSIYILGSIVADIAGGSEGANDGQSGKQGASASDIGSGFTYNYSAGKSGGGGGGQKGHAAPPIGGGGAGGAGGGGGGAGSTRVQKDGRGYPHAGNGGLGGLTGSQGTSAGSQKGGNGGNGGQVGSSGSVYKISIGKNVYIDSFSVTGFYLGEYEMNDATGDIYTIAEEFNPINKYSFVDVAREIEILNCYDAYRLEDFSSLGYKTTSHLNGAFKDSNNNYYKTLIDLSGGYIYALAFSMQSIAKKNYPKSNDPIDLAARVYQEYVDVTGEYCPKLQKLIQDIFFYEHYCEPFGVYRSKPYVKGDGTKSRFSSVDNGLQVIHNSYIKVVDNLTGSSITYSYDTTRKPAVNPIMIKHIYYCFGSSEITIDKYDGKINGNNWMSYIDGNTPITEINMPGSHDCGTFNLWCITELLNIFTDQDRNITSQLKDGARILDCRLCFDDWIQEMEGPLDEHALLIQHWQAEAHDSNGMSLHMDAIFDHCKDFLKDNPRETIVIFYQSEYEDRPIYDTAVENMLKNLENDPENYLILHTGDPVPTLDEVRGRMVIMNWDQVRKFEDHYDVGGNDKIKYLWNVFTTSRKFNMEPKVIDKDKQSPSPKIVFASSYNNQDFIPCNERDAIIVNRAFLRGDFGLMEGYNYGWVLFNFTNASLCRMIYTTNLFVTPSTLLGAPKAREYIDDVLTIDVEDITEENCYTLDALQIPETTALGKKILLSYAATQDGEFTDSLPSQPGCYYVKIQIEDLEYSASSVVFPFKVDKAAYDMSGITFESKAFAYDGKEKTLTVEGKLPEGVTVTYSTNTMTDVGSMKVTATFSGDEEHQPIEPMEATLIIIEGTSSMKKTMVWVIGIGACILAVGCLGLVYQKKKGNNND